MSAGELRRFDSIERVVRDSRRELESLKTTALARLGTHVHPAQSSGVGTVLPGYVEADVTLSNSTTPIDVTGLSVQLEEFARYSLDGWLVWESNTTADITFSWTAPLAATGLWSAFGPVRDQEPIVGGPRLNYIDTGTVSLSVALSVTGDTQIGGVYASASVKGSVLTDETPGAFAAQFSQAVADVSDTVVKAGSWIRLTRLA